MRNQIESRVVTIAKFTAIAFLCVAFLWAPLPTQAQTTYDFTRQCFAVADELTGVGGGSAPDTFVRLDRTTGQSFPIGLTGTTGIEAITFGPNGVLYAADTSQLGIIDIDTGLFTALPQPFGTAARGATRVNLRDVDGLAYDMQLGILFGAQRRSSVADVMFAIDPATGAHIPNFFGPGLGFVEVSLVVDEDGNTLHDVDDFAIDPVTNEMYAAINAGGTGGVLALVDRTTGTATRIATFRYAPGSPLAGQVVDDIEGLSFFNDGQLYGSTGNNGPDANDKNKLFQIDKTTGLVTLVGMFPPGQQDYEAVACLTAQTFIVLQKFTNGPGQAPEDADDPTGPTIAVGAPVTWTYILTNTGAITLTELVLTDDKVGLIGPSGVSNCPPAGTILGPGDGVTCTATGVAQVGQYANTAVVTGTTPVGVITPRQTVTATDPSHYFGSGPAIVIKKATNGEDADTPTGPLIPVGGAVTWTYVVTNTGNLPLTGVTVTDDQGVVVTCPQDTLAPQESITCTGTGIATPGQYANWGSVIGIPPAGSPVTSTDPSHYFGAEPAIVIKKATNGEDADTPTGPLIPVGGAVTWTYVVTNTGNLPLTNVAVTDDQGVVVTCPQTTLAPQASMLCTGTGVAVEGQYANWGTVIGTPPVGTPVSSDDPSHYYGYIPASVGNIVFGDIDPNGATPGEIEAGNGLQDDGEAGIDGVIVQLYSADGTLIGETVTANGGHYLFDDLPPGDYYLVFINPFSEGVWTAPNVGSDDAIDSDPFSDPQITDPRGDAQVTEVFTLASGEVDLSWDAGLIGLSSTASATVGDFVWLDLNHNGIQDAGEPGYAGVTVRLFNADTDTLVGTAQTNQNGRYLFTGLDAGNYYLQFIIPANFTVSPQNVGGDDEVDSDIDPITGRTAVFSLPVFTTDLRWDAGIYQRTTDIPPGQEPNAAKLFLPIVQN
ncbi:MAG: hypothetical protein KF832_21780 [Caldilineaceae bacterium]|nr:hypothetical protein [Caldilineaceae bacterium]